MSSHCVSWEQSLDTPTLTKGGGYGPQAYLFVLKTEIVRSNWIVSHELIYVTNVAMKL